MQDITSDLPGLQLVDEVIISCRPQQQPPPGSQLLHHRAHQQQPPTAPALSATKPPLPPGHVPQAHPQQTQKIITRSQSSKIIPERPVQLKQQQSLPQPLHSLNGQQQQQQAGNDTSSATGGPHAASKSVSILVYKTLNTVFKSSRKIIVRVCEVASAKKSFTMFKFNKAGAQNRAESRANAVTGHDTFVRPPVSDKKAKHLMKKMHKQNGLKRSNSAIEFDVSALTAANRRHLYSSNRSASSEQDNSDHSEHSEKSPLVSARPNVKYQYSALDSGNGVVERSPRERANRERSVNAIQEWIAGTNGRYEVIAHLDEIGSRHGKNWFLVTDASVRTDRLMTLLPLPPDCVALEDLPANENPKGMLMELLGSLHHPYIYPVLDLGFLRTGSTNYACLMTPFNSRGSLKDLIYKAQWNEPWARKYTRKPNCLPIGQIQRLGRQILEALLFLKERGFPLHGHLHSGNVILQNGAARLSGLENGLLGLSSRINAVMWSRSTTEIENVDIICFGHLIYEMCTGQEMTTPKPSMRVLEMELDHYPQILDVLGLIFEPTNGICPSVEELVLCDLFRSIDLRELRGPCFSTIKPSLSRSTLNLLHAVKKRQCASLGNSFSEASSPCTPPSTPRDRRSGFEKKRKRKEKTSLSTTTIQLQQQQQSSTTHHQPTTTTTINSMNSLFNNSTTTTTPTTTTTTNQNNLLNNQQTTSNLTKFYHHLSKSPTIITNQLSDLTQKNDPIICPKFAMRISRTMDSFDISSDSEEGLLDDIVVGGNWHHHHHHHHEQPLHHSHCHLYPGRQQSLMQQQQQFNQQRNQQQLFYASSAAYQSFPQYSSMPQRPTVQPMLHLDMPTDDEADKENTEEAATAAATMRSSMLTPRSLGASGSSSVQHVIVVDSSDEPPLLKSDGGGPDEVPPQNAGQLIDNNADEASLGDLLQVASGSGAASSASSSASSASGVSSGGTFNHQLTADYKNSKSRRLEYSLKCLKYGRSNPSQDSAFGSLTDNDSSSFRISSFQSISSPIDEGVEDIIIATTSAGGSETCLELATIPRSMVSQDSAISSPCRELSPNNFLTIDEAQLSSSGGSSSSTGSMPRPQQFPVSLSPKILVTATTNSSNSSLSSSSTTLNLPQQQQGVVGGAPPSQSQQQQFDPPKILVNDQNSIYTTSPSKRSAGGSIEVFSQKYRVSSFEDMSTPQKRSASTGCCSTSGGGASSDKHHLKYVNRMAFRSLEEERRIDSAFMPMADRTKSENRVNMQSEKYKKLTHASFRISRQTSSSAASSQMSVFDLSPQQQQPQMSPVNAMELQRPATASGASSSRQTMWRDSKFYRKTRIAKSNDSLLETSPNHSRHCLSPSQSLRSSASGLAVTTSFCTPHPQAYGAMGLSSGGGERRYCSSKSEDLCDSNEYLRVMDSRKSYSERHLVTLTKLKQTAINNKGDQGCCCQSEDELSFNDDNNSAYAGTHHHVAQPYEHQQPHHQRYQQQQQQHQQQQQQQQQHQQHQQHQQRVYLQQQQQFFKRPHPNHLSWSSCSINHLKTTNIKTTSLATLPGPSANVSSSSSCSSSSNSSSAQAQAGGEGGGSFGGTHDEAKRSLSFKSLDDGEEDNSSRDDDDDDSPSHQQTLSAAELSKIFANMDDTQGSSCSEEKTPLLDSVEMSPISPSEHEGSAADKVK